MEGQEIGGDTADKVATSKRIEPPWSGLSIIVLPMAAYYYSAGNERFPNNNPVCCHLELAELHRNICSSIGFWKGGGSL